MPVPPRDASTLILIRPASDVGLNVLLVRRRPDSAFLPGYYVYPGGAFESCDCSPDIPLLCTVSAPETSLLDRSDARPRKWSLGAWVAAIRETFEETGIFLAYDHTGALVSPRQTPQAGLWNGCRTRLLGGELAFPDLVKSKCLRLATDRLVPFAHWITPEESPIRFDVRFFLAEAPPDQEPCYHDNELVDAFWTSPAEALARHDRGGFPMVPATISTLRRLATFSSVEAALAADVDLSPVLARMAEKDGQKIQILPDGTVFFTYP